MKVLVADDSAVVRSECVRWLEKWGYEPVEASDGGQALRILASDDAPRMAILDWVMPGMDGLSLCKKLRQRRSPQFIYVLLLTSKTEEEDLVRALDNGAHNFLSKPVSPQVLRAHLAVGGRLVEADDRLRIYAQELERLATVDALTGVYNRRQVLELGQAELSRSRRHGHPFSVLLLDMDHFKDINDQWGHHAGDLALRMVAAAMRETLRRADLLGRLGGDEFVAMLPETDGQHALSLAQRLNKAVRRVSLPLGQNSPGLSITIGVAEYAPDDDQDDLDRMLHRADQALYRAKEAGRDQTLVATSSPDPA